MKIRTKLVLLSIIFIIGIFSVIGLAVQTWKRLDNINKYIDNGIELQVKSRDVQSLMKDMVFDLFVPKIYGQLKSFTYSPRSIVTIRQWKSSVYTYQDAFFKFMAAKEILDIQNRELLDQFETAQTMHEKAMGRLELLDESITMIKDQLGQLDDEKRYNEILGEDTFIPFFEEFRDTSYYFVSSFESFMNYFIKMFRENGENLRREILVLFITLAFLIAIVGIITSLVISRDFLWKLQHVEQALRRVSKGDFSARMHINSHDEFGYLSDQFNELTSDLKQNTENILTLTRDVGSSISESTSLDDLLKIVVNTIVMEKTADAALIYLMEADPDHVGGRKLKLQAFEGVFSEDLYSGLLEIAEETFENENILLLSNEKDSNKLSDLGLSSMLAIPLRIEKEIVSIIIMIKIEGQPAFTDLGVTRLTTFAEYSALTLDNHFKYSELIGKGEAEFQALQSQVQPHFIYNILNGFIGLNRIGAKEDLEKAILSLKDMLRYIQDSRKWTTIGEEFGFVETYCKLQKLRFDERLTYKLDVNTALKDFRIPRLILQPIVENAVIHGLEPVKGQTGYLEISAFYTLEDGKKIINIVTKDNGVGFELDSLAELEHIGIGNVKKRLKYAFPNALFNIKSTPDSGTEVRISLYENHSG
ncbi:MAG: histidine kinase [Bacteroidetes bacterium]|nr:histidine kinase [Bacteroidota bacterium]